MATTSNRERVGRGFEALGAGLEPFIEAHMHRADGEGWAERFARRGSGPDEHSTGDPSFQLLVLTARWEDVFRSQLPRNLRSLVFELRDTRNRWAHLAGFQPAEALRALDSIRCLLEAVDAHEAEAVRQQQDELGRIVYQRERSVEEAANSNVLQAPPKGLDPWRSVIFPHEDVAGGRFSVAEFAADLERVRRHDPTTQPEYRDPRQFFERTYLTRGLRQLLTNGLRRISGNGGSPVINCQTNFGGGKTHSLIALFHLFSGLQPGDLPDEMRELVAAEGIDTIPAARRAVVVGNRFMAGQAHDDDGRPGINTIWGEIAWQLGGADGYAILADSDRARTNPGDLLRTLFARYAPCLVLIDEWVAYARELYGRDDLPGGAFHSQFGFAQALTEAASAVDGVLLVVSIPASEAATDQSDDSLVSDLEVGGVAGREALRQLTNVVSRVAEPWQPAKGDESFEIVRRRLFQPLRDEHLAARDNTAEVFGDWYRRQRSEYPPECAEIRYVERIKSAYPIHPEVFDRLYREWSTVERFQRTRGVLRLMAAVIHSLWDSVDQSPLILPCSVPLDDPRVNDELANKLDDHWRPVIDADVDGVGSWPWQIDRDVPILGRVHATRRVARTIFLGATPTFRSPNRGLALERIRLGSSFPNESVSVADALSRLSEKAPHLYADRNRYWFDVQENIGRTASDDAERLLAGAREEVHGEIVERLRRERSAGEFRRVHVAPRSSDDVADEPAVRLVVLGPDTPHIVKAEDSPALQAARAVLDRRGNVPRTYRNMVVFAAPDQRRLEDLERVTAEHLAWEGIVDRAGQLTLDNQQLKHAETMAQRTDETIGLRLIEAYQWALVPQQTDPLGAVVIEPIRTESQGSIAQRVARKLIDEGALQIQFAPQLLRTRLDQELAPLWQDGHIAVKDLWENFAKYVYLPRLRDLDVLLATAEAAPALMTWQSDGFAVAVGTDDRAGRYLGLVTGSHPPNLTGASLIVHPEFAVGQLEREPPSEGGSGVGPKPGLGSDVEVDGHDAPIPDEAAAPRSFRATGTLDPTRPVKDFGRITQEVIEHLTSLVGTEVTITVTVSAHNSDGLPDAVFRTVMENARTLKFKPELD